MNIFTHIAQATETVTVYSTNGLSDAESAAAGVAAAAVLMTFFFISMIFAVAAYVIGALCLMRIFKKAGAPGWPAWVPVYNTWKTLEIGGQQGFWAILALVPVVNIVSVVMLFIAQYHIGLKLGKSGAFVAWAILVPAVWYIWLAVDKSTWNDAASPAPSLHNPVNTPAAAQPMTEQAMPVAPQPQDQSVAYQAPVTPETPVQPAQEENNNTPQPPVQNY